MDDQQRVQASLQQEATRLSTERDALAQQVQHLEKQLADASSAVSRNVEDRQKLASSLQEEATRLSTERDALAQQVQHLEKQLADASSAVSRNVEDQQKLASSLQEEARQKEEQKHLVATLQEQCSSLAKELEAQIAARQSADNSHQGVPNGDAAQPQAEEAARLTAEREALVQQVRHLEQQLAEAASRASQSTEQYQMLQNSYQEEARQKEEQRQIAISYQEHCNNLTKQVETLREACQNLTTDHQQKAGLEGQVAQLLRMNAQWQQAHQNLNAESEGLRQRLVEVERLQLEVRRLQPFEEASNELEAKLKEAELQLEQRSQALTDLQRQRAADAAAIQRLQGDLESTQETGASEAGHLESELLERSKECAMLRRERNEAHQKLQELMQKSQENSQVADAGRALSTENEKLQQELAMSKEELKSLNAVVERCLSKMEAESRERPFLVDKRMVTQMLAAYLEQRENPGPQQEILHKMADLLGFTSAEREQVGLSQKRKTPLQMQEPQGLADLTDRFVDFLMEESEAG
ncbi:unnamed protein product [Symbiodinium natans]|uniref:GRIP domain-containing protein n=1 Tax=Symbiodinium natans TaxID=878477 RepID=A0A812T692_9DINO|nr:unnamed protein product [Symbiodinium natans]